MGAGGLIASITTIIASVLAFLLNLQKQKAKPACVWIWQGANQTGTKTCLPAGSTSAPFIPQTVICPKGLSLQMKLQNADSSLASISVGSGSSAQLANVISASQTISSVSVTPA